MKRSLKVINEDKLIAFRRGTFHTADYNASYRPSFFTHMNQFRKLQITGMKIKTTKS